MANELVTRRRYARTDIETILGRALATRDEQVVPEGGLDSDVARSTVVELGRTLGLPEDAVLAAFTAEAEEFHLAQKWVESLGGTPSALAVVRHLASGIGRVAPGLSVRSYPRTWVVDHEAHQASRLIHAAELAVLGIFAMGKTPTGGTVPSYLLQIRRVVRPAIRFLGLTLWAEQSHQLAVLTVVDLPNGILVVGEIDDREIAAVVGPLLAGLETRLGDRFEIGRMVVNDLGGP